MDGLLGDRVSLQLNQGKCHSDDIGQNADVCSYRAIEGRIWSVDLIGSFNRQRWCLLLLIENGNVNSMKGALLGLR